MSNNLFFVKIKNIFNRIFNKGPMMLGSGTKETEDYLYDEIDDDFIKKIDEYLYKYERKPYRRRTNEALNEAEKERFFALYGKVRSGKMRLDDLSDGDLVKISTILNEEVKITKL